VKNKTHPYFASLALIVALSSCAAPVTTEKVATKKVAISTPLSSEVVLAGNVFDGVNAYRETHGVSRLERHPGLDQLAQKHCEYLRDHRGTFTLYGKNVSHYGSESRSLHAQTHYGMANCAENIASTGLRGKGTAPHLVKMWSESQSHEQCMRDIWTHTGVGVVVDKDGAVFSTQMFGVVGASHSLSGYASVSR
jgi:uncharacterized protein YkwD